MASALQKYLLRSAPFMASALQKYLRSEYSHSVHGGVSSLLAVVSTRGGGDSAGGFSLGKIPYFQLVRSFQCRYGTFLCGQTNPRQQSPHTQFFDNSDAGELLLAALLDCVSFGDHNPRILFLPMHSRFGRRGIVPLIFWDGCGIFPRTEISPHPLDPDSTQDVLASSLPSPTK